MKNRKKKIVIFGLVCSLFAGGLFFSFYKKGFTKMTNASINIKNASPEWALEKATHQKIIKSVFVSPDGNFTLIEVKSPFLLTGNQGKSPSSIPEILKDKSQVMVVDNSNKKILWTTPEEMDCYFPQWSPDGKEVSFVTFDAQKKNDTLSISEAKKYSPKELIVQPWPISGYLWSPNGKHIAVLISQLTGNSNELGVNFETWKLHSSLLILPLNISTPQDFHQVEFFQPAEYFFIEHSQEPRKVMAWSPDSQHIAFAARKNDLEALFLANIESKEVKTFHRGHHPLYPTYSHNGKWLAFVANAEENEPSISKFPVKKRKVFLKNLQTEKTHVLADTLGYDPYLIGWGANDQSVFVCEGVKTLNKIYKLPIQGNKSELFNPGNTFLSHISLNKSGSFISFVQESLTSSPEVLISSLKKFEPHIVFPEKTQTISLKTEMVHWKSFDELEIEGILVYPVGYTEGKSYPLIVGLHDGPYGAWEQRFLGHYYKSLPFYPAILASEGYIVFLPNVRGSSNYGLGFAHANQEDLGGGDFEDLMTGVDFLIKKGIVDPQQLAIWGWGYGGYLAIWATTQTNRFKAVIVGQAITDFISFAGKLEHSDLLSSYLGGDFWKNKELWFSRSPIMHVEKIQTPIFMQSGVKSASAYSQGKELKYALNARKVPVSFISFDLEGHDFDYLSASREIGMKLTLNWLKKYLTPSLQEEADNSTNRIKKVSQGEKR